MAPGEALPQPVAAEAVARPQPVAEAVAEAGQCGRGTRYAALLAESTALEVVPRAVEAFPWQGAPRKQDRAHMNCRLVRTDIRSRQWRGLPRQGCSGRSPAGSLQSPRGTEASRSPREQKYRCAIIGRSNQAEQRNFAVAPGGARRSGLSLEDDIMANKHRGEIAASLGGRTRTLVLTLGALAELESAFGADDLVALAERFGSGRLSARDLVRIIGAGLRGAGEVVSDDEVAAMSADGGAPGFVRIAAELIAATFDDTAAVTS
jgi:Phage tail tube protein, GTA-gp10